MGQSSRAARRKRHRKALIWSGLRKLFAASAMTTVVRAIIGQSQVVGDHLTDRLAERAKRGLEIGARRILLYLVAGVLFAVAGGFLIAAGFMGLTLLVTPALAAVIVAVVLALAGGATLFFGRLDHEEEANEQPAATDRPAEPARSQSETPEQNPGDMSGADTPSMTVVLAGLLDSVLKYAGRNLGLIAAVLFLIALWFGLGADDGEEMEEDEEDAGDNDEDQAQTQEDRPPVREPAA